MQDIHTTTTTTTTITGAGRFVGDRRLSRHNNHRNTTHNHHHHHHQALKCPRCDSLNTKFCYYNNYNLSQPRHFCKNCRRYWTNGGVLRNVPVGGGCRKSKRSSKPKPPLSPQIAKKIPNSLSSSDSSSATTIGGANGGGNGGELRFSESENYGVNLGLEANQNQNQLLFPAEIGGIMSLMSSNSADQLGLGGGAAAETASFGEFMQSEQDWGGGGGGAHQHNHQGVVVDPTVMIEDDLVQNRGSSDELAALDWGDHHHQGLFDFTSTEVDHHHQSYWSQTTSSLFHHHQQQHQHQHLQWCDNNSNNGHSLFPDFLS